MKNRKKIIFFAFAAIILLVPIYVVITSQDILDNGKLYKFKPQAYDPFDPFRGKFLRINYDTRGIPTDEEFERGDEAYVLIGEDEEGWAYFKKVFKTPPKEGDYLTTTIDRVRGVASMPEGMRSIMEDAPDFWDNGNYELTVDIVIPDNMQKYFINEGLAKKAERVFNRERENIYVGIRIKNGASRLEDIYVDKTPFLEYLKR